MDNVAADEAGVPVSLDVLSGFAFERLLSEDTRTRSAALLGSFPSSSSSDRTPAILLVEKTHFSAATYHTLASSGFEKLSSLGQNDIYTWILGWFGEGEELAEGKGKAPDAKMTLIKPCTETHILKYSMQARTMMYETPEMYDKVVRPWIEAIPEERTRWVVNILEKKKEADRIAYEDSDPKTGFIILPDLKWDQRTLASLYMIAIVHDTSLRSIRDLRSADGNPDHVELLRKIKAAAEKVAREKYGLSKEGKVRCFLHYQPSYYHLHVHITSADYTSHPGLSVGQAHLLEDVIDQLELGIDFSRRTLGYSLGERAPLLEVLRKAGYGGGMDGEEGERKEVKKARME